MKYITLKRLALISVLMFAACAGTSSFADSSCALALPPLDAAVSGNHGQYLFVFPRKVTASFSGCQTMWDEQGRKVFVMRFSDGTLNEYSYTDFARGPITTVCKYEKERLSASSPAECSNYKDVKGGLLNVAPEDEPPVPRERDARLKRKN